MRMLKASAVFAIVLGVVTTMASGPVLAQDFSITIPKDTIRAPEGSVVLIDSAAVPSGLEGQTCTVSVTDVSNNPSLHDNDLIVTSQNTITVFAIEDGQGTKSAGGLVLGTTLSFSVAINNTDASDNGAIDPNTGTTFPPNTGTYSAALRVDFDCEPPPPLVTSASATGQCVEEVFRMTVTNTGETEVTGDVEGYGGFTLAPGAIFTVDISDAEPGETIRVTFGQDIPEALVPVPDCTPDVPPFVEFEALVPVCIQDIPYISYDAAVSEDLAGSLADIRLLDLNGVEVANYPQQPLQGLLIWPGASADPEDWPGWRLNEAGFWVLDPTDDFLRDGIIVEITVNPTEQETVSYPPATSACDGPATIPSPGTTPRPPIQPPGITPEDPPANPPSALPVTGDETEVMMLIALLLLGIGGSLLGVSRRTQH